MPLTMWRWPNSSRMKAGSTDRKAAATGILVFIFSWNEFVVALSLTGRNTATVPVGISKYSQEFEIKYAEMAAAAFLSVLPAFVLLLFGQRHIVKGITAGAVK